MVVNKAAAIPIAKIEKYPYKGKPLPVKEVWISWLSKVGPDGSPEYGGAGTPASREPWLIGPFGNSRYRYRRPPSSR